MLLFDDGYRRLYVKHLVPKRGIWWYQRRIPVDLQARFGGLRVKRLSLGTRNPSEAARKAAKQAAIDDAAWSLMRDPHSEVSKLPPADLTKAALGTLQHLQITPGATGREAEWNTLQLSGYFEKYAEAREDDRDPYTGEHPPVTDYLTAFDNELIRLVHGDPTPKRLSDALAHYLKDHEKGNQVRFARDATRVIDLMLRTAGDLPLESYKREHAEAFRDAMLATGVATTTVARRIRSIAAVFADGITAFSLNLAGHPFQGLKIRGLGSDAKTREPFTDQELATIARAIREHDDDKRYILGLQLNTGARLAEIVGLKASDVVLADTVPHIVIRPYPERSLKSLGSARLVPLVGVTLWSAQRALELSSGGSPWLFPRYMTATTNKSNSASATLNKWLQKLLNGSKTNYSFRHAIKDRLRDTVVPEEIQEAIMGHGKSTIAKGYGSGYSLETVCPYLEKIAI